MSVENFLDNDGKVTQWPKKHSNKLLVVAYLATKFKFDITYHENGVNEVLKQWHTFCNWPLLRRSLIDYGFMERDVEGTRYKRNQ